jgi:hypothetical protein
MKAKVLIPFRDRETKKEYKKNDIIDVTVSRFNEIIRKGHFIEAAEETKTQSAKA